MEKITIKLKDYGMGATPDWVGDVVAAWDDEKGEVVIYNRTKAEWQRFANERNSSVESIQISQMGEKHANQINH